MAMSEEQKALNKEWSKQRDRIMHTVKRLKDSGIDVEISFNKPEKVDTNIIDFLSSINRETILEGGENDILSIKVKEEKPTNQSLDYNEEQRRYAKEQGYDEEFILDSERKAKQIELENETAKVSEENYGDYNTTDDFGGYTNIDDNFDETDELAINTGFDYYVDKDTGAKYYDDDTRIYEKDKRGHIIYDETGKPKIREELEHHISMPMSGDDYEQMLWDRMTSKYDNLASEAGEAGEMVRAKMEEWRDNYSVSEIRSAFEAAAADGYEISFADLYMGDTTRLGLLLEVTGKYLPGYEMNDLYDAIRNFAEYEELRQDYEYPV